VFSQECSCELFSIPAARRTPNFLSLSIGKFHFCFSAVLQRCFIRHKSKVTAFATLIHKPSGGSADVLLRSLAFIRACTALLTTP
jgi:hypothetical protein